MGKEVTCPSGLVVELRGLEMSEACILTDRQEAQAGSYIGRVLAMCTERLVSPGPYPFIENVDWGKAHVGDRMYALIRIRKLTYRQPYRFGVPCSACRAPIDWDLDLDDVPMKPLPPAALEAMKSDRILEARWETMERNVRFRMLIGDDEKRNRLALKERPKEAPLVALMARIVSVEGVSDKDRVAFLGKLGAEAMMDLIATMDEQDGGVDTSIPVSCTHCGAGQVVDLPFDREFWLPKIRRMPKL